MNPSDTAREAFFIEALGDMAELIARLEACAPALEASQRQLLHGCEDLAQQATDLERRTAAVVERINVVAPKYIAHRVHEASRAAAEAQVRAMETAAQALFRTEIGPALERMARPLQSLVADLSRRCGNRWESALNHAATAAVAANLTWWLADFACRH
jgi:predicted component of type VI protein secretion system